VKSLLWIVVIIGSQFALLWWVAGQTDEPKILKRWTALIVTIITVFALNLWLSE
jgi:hypothetical protein